jgi:hypothetical protein
MQPRHEKLFLKVINHYWLDDSCPAEWKKLKIIRKAKPGIDFRHKKIETHTSIAMGFRRLPQGCVLSPTNFILYIMK